MAPARTEDGFDVFSPKVPVTEQRRPFIQKDGDQKLKDPATILQILENIREG
jgi:peroxygenase